MGCQGYWCKLQDFTLCKKGPSSAMKLSVCKSLDDDISSLPVRSSQDIVLSVVLVVGFAVSGIVEGVSSAKLENRGEDWWKHTAAASVSLTHTRACVRAHVAQCPLWSGCKLPALLAFAACYSLTNSPYSQGKLIWE